MLRTLLFQNFYVVYRFDQWMRLRFTPAGKLLLGTLVVAGVFGVNIRATTAYQIFIMAAALIAFAVLAAPLFRGRFTVTRRLPRYATVGEPLRYRLIVRNLLARRWQGLSVVERLGVGRPKVADFHDRVDPEDARRNWFDRHVGYPRWAELMRWQRGGTARPAEVPDLLPAGSAEVEMQLTPHRRGYLRFAGVWLLRPDPLGLFRARLPGGERESVLALPKRYPVSWVELTGHSRDRPGGMSQAASIGGSDEFAALREYRPGDPMRHIDWKGWARTGTPIVKEFHEECFVRQALVLDTCLPRTGTRPQFEDAVSVAASFTHAAPVRQGVLDLVFLGAEAYQISAGPGLASTDRILEALACVTAGADDRFPALRQAVLERAAEFSACVCVLLDWDRPRREFVAALRQIGMPLLVLVVTATGEHLDGDPGPMAGDPERFRVLRAGDVAAGLGSLLVGARADG